ncbi:MAG: ATP-binding cassette domain-containing protein [Bacteroidaceae bacterium]|nr:ATP-binding cassette domain-containing protein [Bacteroidaceae bacterium]MBR3906988.1 ATP-binding cassette domain-containing protein [Bacteroidaceae bacterium]
MDILKIENVTKSFANHVALDDVSLTIPEGSIYGLLGPNGAGKTTLLRIINRITTPNSGRVLFCGKEISAEDIYNIGYMPEERGLYKKMKVGEQAVFFARLKGMSRKDATAKLKEWFGKFGIEDWWNREIGELSKGMAQKVQFITTVLHEPKLLIFDEPFSGFDPINANMLKSEILALRDKGTTIIFSTHNMSSVEEVCDHITLIDKSRNILSGNVDEIRHKHGANIFEISYRGNEEALNGALAGICEIMESKSSLAGYNTMKIHIATDAQVRNVIDKANSSVEIRSFSEVIPSMNDIFIRAVNGNL